jgi:methionyl-tRNA synthetase
VAHGWLLFEESKMSKSRGNIVRSETILEVLGADALRYFLFREIVFGQDGSFSFDALVQRFNSDLANGLGNLASRTLSMIQRYFAGEVPYPSATLAHTPAEAAISKLAGETIVEYNRLFEAFHFSRALEALWSLLSAVDKYIVETQPWAVAEKEDRDSRSRLATILYTSAEALRIITTLAHPIIPDSTAKIFSQLGLSDIAKTDLNTLRWGQLNVGTRLGRIEAVFPRADKSAIERMQQMEEERKSLAESAAAAAATATATAAAVATAPLPPAPAATAAPAAPAANSLISIDDFAKVDLRVGTVLTAEKVEKADKLLRLTVDIGTEVRQIVAGIAKTYAPETLLGRKVVIVANLAPRKLRGIESQGMIVAASYGDEGLPALVSVPPETPNGSRLK